MERSHQLIFKITISIIVLLIPNIIFYPSLANPESTPAIYLPLVMGGSQTQPAPTTTSLRFYGNGTNDIDRVKIPIVNSSASLPVNIGATDFTLEFWLRFEPNQNQSGPCSEGSDTWIYGNIIYDNRIAFGVHNGSSGFTICGNTTLAANTWHHIAVTRSTNGVMSIFVNGVLDQQITNGPSGNISYRVGRSITGSYVNEPFLVIGAEKHDYDRGTYPSFSGWTDEVRISNVIRYSTNFTPPNAPFTSDSHTVGLYHFDEGTGNIVLDSSNASGGPSHGTRNFGGSPEGPQYDSLTKRF